MKKSMRMVSVIMAAVMSMSAVSALAVSASAEETAPISYAQTMDEMFDRSHDASAPNVNKTAFENSVKNAKEVGMYNIREGKYYVVATSKRVRSLTGYRAVPVYHLVKVERAFEDGRWWGTERTIDVRFCDTGETKRICPAAWLEPTFPFYEIGSFVC